MSDNKTNQKRRVVLKTAGVAGAAAGAAWHKPVLNAVMTPAHAQTSAVDDTSLTTAPPTTMMPTTTMAPPIVVAGASSSSMTGNIDSGVFDKIADGALEALIPSAQAGGMMQQAVIPCGLFFFDNDDYTHCIQLTLPGGEDVDGEVQVDLSGPQIYYNFGCEINSYYYYEGVRNFNDSDSTSLSNRQFTISLAGGDVEIVGEVNADFTAASGTMTYEGVDIRIGQNGPGSQSSPYYCYGGGNRGAFWTADLAGVGTCQVGGGLDSSTTAMINLGPTAGSCGS